MNIVLIGMPGVGKSYLGKILAEELGYSFVDPDRLLEEQYGMSLASVIAKTGEEAFIEVEGTSTVDTLHEDTVIATGGSVVYNEVAMATLKERALVIHLTADPSHLEKNIDPTTRGVIGMSNKNFMELYAERIPLYEKWAHISVATNRPREEVMDELMEKVHAYRNR